MKKVMLSVALVTGIVFAGTGLFAATYALHIAGLCTTDWTDGNGDAVVGNWGGITSVNCRVDTTVSIPYASSQFKNYLNTYCTGSNWCYLLNHSTGDATIGYTLANNATNWNIVFVASAAGAAGGSELALKHISSIFTCNCANDLWPSTVRNMYNHNDTNGEIVYRIGGYDGWWYTSWMLPGEDDGVEAFHSSGGCVSTGSYNNLCSCSHWTNHNIAYTCGGYDLDHYEIKMKFVKNLGGN